jgi:two-component system OmpR family response regulator
LAAINTRPRIMVVDDDQDMRQLLDNTLAPEGFDTFIIADGDVTLTLLDRVEPDLVILDAKATGVPNFHRLYQIRNYSDVPIIILAPDCRMESLRRAFSLGADDYIRKPFERRAFLARIRAKLRRAGEYSRGLTPVTT